jgi:hypothetical protein
MLSEIGKSRQLPYTSYSLDGMRLHGFFPQSNQYRGKMVRSFLRLTLREGGILGGETWGKICT